MLFRSMSTLSDLLSRKSLWRPQNLGPLESEVLRVLSVHGEGSVRDVLNQLDRPLAYTTVMMGITFVLAALSYELFERQFLKLKRRMMPTPGRGAPTPLAAD